MLASIPPAEEAGPGPISIRKEVGSEVGANLQSLILECDLPTFRLGPCHLALGLVVT